MLAFVKNTLDSFQPYIFVRFFWKNNCNMSSLPLQTVIVSSLLVQCCPSVIWLTDGGWYTVCQLWTVFLFFFAHWFLYLCRCQNSAWGILCLGCLSM